MKEEDIFNSAMLFISYYRAKGCSDKWITNRFNVILNRILFEENMYQYMVLKNYVIEE